MQVEVTRRLEFDAGHRIPDHKSKCRNAHGHRYVLEVTAHGPIINSPGSSDNGMIVDFGDLKDVMAEVIVDPWDHSFLVSQDDLMMIGALAVLGKDHRTVMLPFVPTVENLAHYAFAQLSAALKKVDLTLTRVVLFETPNCHAEVKI